MLRLLFFLAILYVVWAALKSYFGSRRSKSQESAPGVAKGEEMVLDPQCQSYVPKAEAVLQAGKYFCSQECARLYLAR
jgi:hypothetical protein